MVNHGVNATEAATKPLAPAVVNSGIPYFIGTAPIHTASSPALAGKPVLCRSFEEAQAVLGYSEDWDSYSLCEAMYSHLKLYKCQPVIFCNVLDMAAAKESVAAADMTVEAHQIKLPFEAINDTTLIVKKEGGAGETASSDTDYSAFYDGKNLIIELLENGVLYNETSVNIAYSKINPSSVTTADVAGGIEGVELCLPLMGIIPDLLVAPKYSKDVTIAAAMAAKAANINGILKAKALIDIDTDKVKTHSEVKAYKEENGLTDSEQIACWPMVKNGGYKFHLSTQLAGVIARVDSENEDCPYVSPSNKPIEADGLCLADGTEITLTPAQANSLNDVGVVCAMRFFDGWVAWGNYTACYPESKDIKDYYISISRVFKWVDNTLVKTFWKNVDAPNIRRMADAVVDAANIWINGLVGKEFLYGGRFELREDENSNEDVKKGIIKIHTYLAAPPPLHQFDFVQEYDLNYIKKALGV